MSLVYRALRRCLPEGAARLALAAWYALLVFLVFLMWSHAPAAFRYLEL